MFKVLMVGGVLSCFNRVQLFVTPWTVASQDPLSMGFPRQEYWRGLPFPPPGDLPDPGIESASLVSPALAGRFFTTSATWEAPKKCLFPWNFHWYCIQFMCHFGDNWHFYDKSLCNIKSC